MVLTLYLLSATLLTVTEAARDEQMRRIKI